MQDGGEEQGFQSTGSTSPGSGDQEEPWRVRATRSNLCSHGLLWLLCSGETLDQEARSGCRCRDAGEAKMGRTCTKTLWLDRFSIITRLRLLVHTGS